jgi:N6-adenosine-specific RNA methylase IME4
MGRGSAGRQRVTEPTFPWPVHPAAELFPLIGDEELHELADDIKRHGLHEPVWLWKDPERGTVLLDGRNRTRACQIAGVDDFPVRWYDGDDPIAFSISANKKRRHLTPGQLAFLAEDVERLYAAVAARNVGGRPRKEESKPPADRPEVNPRERESRERAAKVVGARGRNVSKAKRVQREAPDLAEEVKRGTLALDAAERQVRERAREQRRAENEALVQSAPPLEIAPDMRYQAIVIDPPWDWGDEGDADQFGRARPTYQTMSYGQLTELPVGEQADSNAHLYLWITNRSLPKGFGLLEAWGFRYITMLTWCKPHFGMGNYYRGQTEHVLFGVRGSLPLLRRDRGTWFEAPRPGRHSGKPDAFYELVEECSPGPWLEMFSRSARPGWAAWGAEAP